MDLTRLPELKERVTKDEDANRPLVQQGDESPRQSDVIDWLNQLLSAPPLAAEN